MSWQREPDAVSWVPKGIKRFRKTTKELRSHTGQHWLNENQLCQLLTNGQSGIADLADEVVAAGDQPDDLVLTQTDLTEAILNFRCGAQLFYPHGHAGLHAAQWADFTSCFLGENFCSRVHIHGKSFLDNEKAD